MKKSYTSINDPAAPVHEPAIAYAVSPGQAGIKSGYDQLLAILETPVYQGKLLRLVLEVTGLPLVYLAEVVFEMTPKTLNTYIKDVKKSLPARYTEHAYRLLELYYYGAEVLGDLDTMRRWMSRQAYGMHRRVPMTYLNTLTGIEFIRAELVRIEFGATA